MRILLVGDQHFRNELPYGAAFKDGRRSEWNAVKAAIHEASEGCDAVVLLGDNLNSRHNHSSVIREFVDFLNGFGTMDVYSIAGNHERYGTSTALDFLKEVDRQNWRIFTEVETIESNGMKMTFMPYMTAGSLGVKNNEESVAKLIELAVGGDILFTHHAIAGAEWGASSTEHMNEPVLPLEGIEAKYGRIFAGHIHKPQYLSPRTLVTGSIFTSEVGEGSKSVYVYDTKDDSVKDIKLPVRGIYKIVWENFVSEPSHDTESVPPNSIVKCYVTSRQTNLEDVKRCLKSFDASIIIEQYPRERTKVHFQEGGLNLSIDNMLKVYSDVRKVDYGELKAGFDIIRK